VLKITFLGTGTSQGIPVIGSDHPVSFSKDLKDKRLRSSILVQYGDIAFSIDCGPDFRQKIADSWPASIDDDTARSDWGWESKFDLSDMVNIMFDKVKVE